MKNKVFTALLFLILFSLSSASAQEIKSYTLGEVLTYEGKFSKSIIRGISVADMKFSVENAPDGTNYLVKSEAKSKGTLAKLLRFTFLQQMESTVDGDKLRILNSKRHDEQNERVRDSEAIFDYLNKQVTFIETNPKDAMRAPRKVASQIESDTQDFITGLYSLRSMPLAVGKAFELTISDSGLVYKVPVRVTARVKQKSVLGNVWCFRLEADVFGIGRLIEQEGSLFMWITDDTRRIPVRGQINAEIGRVEIRLRTVSYKPKENKK
jgi:Protein of unknown function (DUF3108)